MGLKALLLTACLSLAALVAEAATWNSRVTGSDLQCRVRTAANPLTDAKGRNMTVVYLENLACEKIGQNPVETDVQWLLDQGYQVVEVDYAGHPAAKSPDINMDIIAINDALSGGSFGGATNCSDHRSYILFEGYRLARDLSYYKDDPTVYNYPGGYTEGDSLYMDVAYPANASRPVPVVLSFSYSNSWHGNEHRRLFLGYTLAMFDDSFLEGAPAVGIAWAMADHPKYCDWGNGKPVGGANKDYSSFEVNPDAARKVKSAVRTLRGRAGGLGLSGQVGIYGFSRGSDAGSMAVGDKYVADFEQAGLYQGLSSAVQVAALGSGVFDFTEIYQDNTSGDERLETLCPKAWGELRTNRDKWEYQSSVYLVETQASAPVIFFYNHSDAQYYQAQIARFQRRLKAKGIEYGEITDYASGHAVPMDTASLAAMYRFFDKHLQPSPDQSADLPGSAKPVAQSGVLAVPFDLRVVSSTRDEITCSFSLSAPAEVEFSAYDITGHLLLGSHRTLGAGVQTVKFNTTAMRWPQGVYLLRLTAPGGTQVQRFTIR
ncbi:MAG: T9SS type A sorting domain-containing protein [Bacteroidales bacterium]|nr:T9SS type A sorting domain-containing protein [Bacteroidales bacterium]